MTKEQGNTFGERLRRLREVAGLTQEELAERAGLTPKGVGALERGERTRPYPHTVRALADALGLVGEERTTFIASTASRDRKTEPESSLAVRLLPLPVPPTQLVGREREVGEAVDMLRSDHVRLLTLTGPGGVGKTRLAIEIASRLATHFPDGVAFVGVAPLEDPDLLLDTIGHILGLREVPGQTARQTLDTYLESRNMLLVLDNFEHLLGAAGEVAGLLSSSSALKLLVTSRAPLRLRAEREYPVGPLELPSMVRVPSVPDVVRFASVQLFVERAQAASPAFELTQANSAAVTAICRRLEGLPLAIELAAPKVKLLTPTALLSRLDQSLLLLTGGARDLPVRQQTMETAIRWSYELLESAEARLFRRLSVFRGGWTLGAAEAVAEQRDALEGLGRLVEQSLVLAEPEVDGDEFRYRMLEPIRHYALQALEESGESEEVRGRHAAYYRSLVERAGPELIGPDQIEWFDWLEQEYGNIRAALGYTISGGHPDLAALMGWDLWLFWWVRGPHSEGRRWMEAVLERALPPGLRPRALVTAAAMAYAQGDYARSEEYCREALELSRRAGDITRIGHASMGLGLLMISRREYEAADAYMAEALRCFRAAQDSWGEATIRVWSGVIPLVCGDFHAAKVQLEEGIRLARGQGDRILRCNALYNLALTVQAMGDDEEAAALFREGALLAQQMSERANVAYCLGGLAIVAGRRGHAARAARLVGAAEGLLASVGIPVYGEHYMPNQELTAQVMAAVRAELGAQSYDAAWGEGQALTPEQAVQYALEGDE